MRKMIWASQLKSLLRWIGKKVSILITILIRGTFVYNPGNNTNIFISSRFEGVNKEKSTLRAGGVWTTSNCFHQYHHKCSINLLYL